MSIYISKNNQQVGPFEESAVLEWLKTGQLSGEDFGCRAGEKEWHSLKTLFAIESVQAVTNLLLIGRCKICKYLSKLNYGTIRQFSIGILFEILGICLPECRAPYSFPESTS